MNKLVIVAVSAALLFPITGHAAEYVVKMKFDEDNGKVFFEPGRLEIALGDVVTWIQEDVDNEHNVVSYPNGIPRAASLFRSPMMKRKGESWSMRFSAPGSYAYHCHPHEAVGMKGMIVVERESRPDEVRRARPGERMHYAGGHGQDNRAGHHGGHHDH